MRPQRRSRATDGQRDVLADRALHEQGLGAVGRHVHQAGPDGIGRVPERHRGPVDEELAAARTLRPGEDVEQLVLPLALERHDAEHLTRVELERHVLELGAGAEAAGRGAAAVASGLDDRPWRSPWLRSGNASTSPSISSTIRSSEPAVTSTTPTVTPFAQHGRSVADGGDLDHAMGDEDDRAIAAPLSADDLEDALGQVRRQCRGHLVEHEDVGLDREGAREIDDPERRQRYPPRQARQILTLEAQLANPVPERLEGRIRSAAGSTGCRGPG